MHSIQRRVIPFTVALLMLASCGGDDDMSIPGAGGTSGSGGSPATGGAGGSGVGGGAGGSAGTGAAPGSGGDSGSGGAGGSGAEGGAAGTGGAVGPGGTAGVGGAGGTDVGGSGGSDVGGSGGSDVGGSGGAGTGGTAGSAGSDGGAGGTGGTRAITAMADVFRYSCDNEHDYEVWSVAYTDTGETVTNYTCSWTFTDGGTSDSCVGVHEFSSAGFFDATVVVTDTATGATTSRTMAGLRVVDPLSLEVTAEAPPCGLSFSYTVTKTGGRTGGFTFLGILPWETVITPGPYPTQSGTIEVSAPGTYTVTVYREEETNGPICTASAMTTVSVNACP